MPEAARVFVDSTECPLETPGTPPTPHEGGPILGPGAPTVTIGYSPAALETEVVVCIGAPDALGPGATTVLICDLSPARKGDLTEHGAEITSGCMTVKIGDTVLGASIKKAGAPLVQICEDPGGPVVV
jgi:uncharacterized Zn-binding protein involved in type VI secretion